MKKSFTTTLSINKVIVELDFLGYLLLNLLCYTNYINTFLTILDLV